MQQSRAALGWLYPSPEGHAVVGLTRTCLTGQGSHPPHSPHPPKSTAASFRGQPRAFLTAPSPPPPVVLHIHDQAPPPPPTPPTPPHTHLLFLTSTTSSSSAAARLDSAPAPPASAARVCTASTSSFMATGSAAMVGVGWGVWGGGGGDVYKYDTGGERASACRRGARGVNMVSRAAHALECVCERTGMQASRAVEGKAHGGWAGKSGAAALCWPRSRRSSSGSTHQRAAAGRLHAGRWRSG
jgi:hypothetical protein